MTPRNGHRQQSVAPEPALFSAVVTPNRSLSHAGFLIVMAIVGGTSFVAGMAFLLLGAWPVFGFFGLDVVLIYWAFRANYRAATAFEEVTVTASELRVRKSHDEFGIERLFLVSRGRRLPIASLLGPQEKESFAAALGAAIGEAKRGPTRTVLE